MRTFSRLAGWALLGSATVGLAALPPGLFFHASFDTLTATADVAGGAKESSFTASLDLRSAEGVKGAGLLQQAGERCSYEIKGNLDTRQGTFSIWVKPLNWDGHSGKFRHFLVASPAPDLSLLLYLYPIGDEAVFNYIRVGAGTPQDATWRAGAPVDMLKRNEWTQLVSTWDGTGVRLYANAKRVGEGLVGAPLPPLPTGSFTICPIDFWRNAQWGDPQEQTICDEVRVFDHALSDEEVLDLYGAEVPGGLTGMVPKLVVELTPDYFAKTIDVTLRPAHLTPEWEARLGQGAAITLTVRAPNGQELLSRSLPSTANAVRVPVPAWADGDYTAVAEITVAEARLSGTATLTKPPTPWLPAQTDWRAERVLPPWTPLRREGTTVRYWNGEVALPGALPTQMSSGGEALLTAPVRLVGAAPAAWQSPTVLEEQPFRVSFRDTGTVGALSVVSTTQIEFDGMIRIDVSLTPPPVGAQLGELTLEIPLRAEVARYYRNPVCRDWDGKSWDEKAFEPYGWLGNERRGLAWFMESSANWSPGADQPAVTLRREGEAVVVRLHLISTPTAIPGEISYTIGLQPTPVRPLSADLYEQRFASGPQFKGSNLFVYGWGQQLAALSGGLTAYDPAAQRALVDRWRADGKESLSYTCTQCTANCSPEYLFFRAEWNQPYGATFAGYKRLPDNAPYSIVPTCPRSSFADFLVGRAQEHLRQDWSGGLYTDIDGAISCDNARHGCGFKDAFGRSGRTWPLYAHRALSRRLYAACHDAGKLYFSHAHSNWYSLFNAFNDGWCPGEQYSSAVIGKPSFYMDEIPDRTWRTEFSSTSTGVPTFLLPELDRLAGAAALQDPGPSASCLAMALSYGVPLWAGSINQRVVEEVWAVQQQFGLRGAQFVPFWEQREWTVSDPAVRLSLWRKPGARLLALTNLTAAACKIELRPSAGRTDAQYRAGWNTAALEVSGGAATLTVAAKSGTLLLVSLPDGK
jgi:hypothetical protein